MPAGPQSRRELDWRALKVLIVDHDDRFRFWARTVFGHKRVAEVLSVAPGSEAIRMLGHTMLDVSLVEASPDGINFVKRLRDKTASPCPGLHVILLINADDETQIRAASEAGIESVIRKPVSEGALLERVAATVLNPRRIVWSESYVGPERRTLLSSTTPGPRRRASDRTEGETPPRKERPAAAAATPAPAERAVPTQVRGGVRASPGSAERVRQRASAWDEEMEQKVEQDDSESAAPDAAGRAAAEADTAWQEAVTPPEPSPPEPPGLNVARILADHDEWVASRGQKRRQSRVTGRRSDG